MGVDGGNGKHVNAITPTMRLFSNREPLRLHSLHTYLDAVGSWLTNRIRVLTEGHLPEELVAYNQNDRTQIIKGEHETNQIPPTLFLAS